MADILDRLRAALADRYRIEKEIGSGGMATVYLAQDLKHERRVAIKALRPELAASLGADRFLREIKITANLNHPHILPLHDSGEADGFLYYVMPFVEGESLRDRLVRDDKFGARSRVRPLHGGAVGWRVCARYFDVAAGGLGVRPCTDAAVAAVCHGCLRALGECGVLRGQRSDFDHRHRRLWCCIAESPCRTTCWVHDRDVAALRVAVLPH